MENSEKLKTTQFDLDKEIMRSWLEIIPTINQSKDHELEKTLKLIQEKLSNVSSSGFFSKENLTDDIEKFFLASFSPSLIKKISNENILNNNNKEILRNIIQIYILEFIKNLENPNFLEMWESIAESFRDDKSINRSTQIDSADKFLVITLIIYRK